MEKILGRLMRTKKVGSTMADPTPTDDDVDLSSWEFVNPSSSSVDEDIEDYFFDDSGDDDEEEEEEEEEEMEIYVLDASSSDLDLIRHDIDIPDVTHVPIDEPVSYDYEYKYYNDYADDHEEEEEEEEKEDYDDEYDDELVPRSVSDRFGKQRLMKLGKRAKPKMNNPKKLPCYYYNRPGGVHGKNHVVDWKRKIIRKKEAY